MIANAPEVAGLESASVRGFMAQLGRITGELQDVGMSLRMVPVRGLFQKMRRLLRDVAVKSGKRVRLVVSGEGTEIDRSIVERVADPLVHMIRNAVSHGIEDPETRAAAGKPVEGTVWLTATAEGGSIVIEVRDDGRGIDCEGLLQRAQKLGLIAEGDELAEPEIHNLVFQPGVSTARAVTEVAGRGVGMDVVKRGVNGLRGRVAISSSPGEGTTFRLILPLTLAIIDGMVVTTGSERYIIPTLSIVESIQVDDSMVSSVLDLGEMVTVRGECIPLLRLARIFGVTGAASAPGDGLVVILEGVGQKVGLLVDSVLSQQQVVIKSLGHGIDSERLISGAAILSDGRVGLILNVDELTAMEAGPGPVAGVRGHSAGAAGGSPDATSEEGRA
jgi:two-component system chemotaxis sensor kinase CheA